MATLLAIDTATDALSLALAQGDDLRTSHEVIPRRHHQELYPRLDALLDGAAPASLGLDAIVYGRGPGSFTGLRIAASAAQGLAYSLDVPVIGLSSLETQARTWLRQYPRTAPCLIASTIDARIGQVYAAFYAYADGQLTALGAPDIVAPEDLALPVDADPALPLVGIGSGFALRDQFGEPLCSVAECCLDVLPEARDMLAPARELLAQGSALAAADAIPDYVQRRIGWKTLAEQGRKA